MPKGKGLTFAAAGALIGAFIWGALSLFTGWNLWFLLPIVGGAAGLGMMYGTQMRGGTAQGLSAAAFAVVAIFGARFFVVGRTTQTRLEQEAVENMIAQVAADMEKRDGDAVNDAGEFKPEVKAMGIAAWVNTSPSDKRAYLEALRAHNGESMTAINVFMGFGLFGMICTALAAGAAFKSANMSLERILVLKGLATDTDALNVAASMRAAQAAREQARAAEKAGGQPAPTTPGTARIRFEGGSSQDKRDAA